MPVVKHVAKPEITSLSGVFPAVCTEKERERIWQECMGLDNLGLVDEAKVLIDSLPQNGPEWARFRALHVRLDAWGPEADRAATKGLFLIEQDGPSPFLIDSTCIALLSAGRAKESWGLMQRHVNFSNSYDQGYGWSCHASAAGDFEAALRFFLSAASDWEPNLPRALVDVDLMPLWEHLATGSLTEAQIHVLGNPQFEVFLNEYRSCGDLVEIDWQMQCLVPRACRRWLVQNPMSKLWGLSPKASQRDRQCYKNWQKELRDRNVGHIAVGIRRAKDWFLGRQMAWSVEKAGGGNFLGARWHLTWAMIHSPAMFPEFEIALRPFPELAPVLEDFKAIHDVDPLLLQSMAKQWSLRSLLDRNTMEDWETRIPGANVNGLYLAIKGNSENATNEPRKLMVTLMDLARRWPADPYPWVNLMDLCCREGLWDKARICAQRAPRSAWYFRIFPNLIKQMDHKDRGASRPFNYEPFYGQKNLGGIMCAPSFEYEPGER